MSTSDSCYNTGYILRICAIAALGGILLATILLLFQVRLVHRTSYFHLSPLLRPPGGFLRCGGCVIGSFSAGYLSKRFGRKKSLMVSALLFTTPAVALPSPTSFTIL